MGLGLVIRPRCTLRCRTYKQKKMKTTNKHKTRKILMACCCVFLLLGFCACALSKQTTTTDLSGQWSCSEGSGAVYSVRITYDRKNINIAHIQNFHLLGNEILVLCVIENRVLKIPKQEVLQGILRIEGLGIIKNNRYIELVYTCCDGAQTDTITAKLFIVS